MTRPYCTQNEGHCSTCSLVNYNRDCQNIPIQGGRREGAGRKPTGRKKHTYYVTEAEDAKLREYLQQSRKQSK